MLLPMLEVGYGNYIFTNQVLMICNPDSKPTRRIISKAKENNTYIDLTFGRAGTCLIILNNGEVAMSAIDVNTIKKRYMRSINEINTITNIKANLEPFLELGFKNYILPYNVTGIYKPGTNAMNRFIKNARNQDLLIDCKQGRSLRSVIKTTSDYVILSSKNPDTIMEKYMQYVKEVDTNTLGEDKSYE